MKVTESSITKSYEHSKTSDLSRSMRQIDEVLVRSAVGSMPNDYDYIWNPLEQLDGVQVAQERLLSMQTHQVALENNLVTRSQVMRQLQSDEAYQYGDGTIEQLEVLEDGMLFDEPENDDDVDVDLDIE